MVSIRFGVGVFQRIEINPKLPSGFDKSFALPQQQLAAFDNHRKLGERAFDLRNETRQFGQFALDRTRRRTGGQQLGQTLRGCHFLKIEIREPMDFTRRHDQAATVPAADRRHGNPEQIGEHGGRIQTAHMLLAFDQSQSLPE